MKPFTVLAIVFFSLVCLGHILRLLLGWDVVVDAMHLPLWASAVAAIVTGLLAFMLWQEARRK